MWSLGVILYELVCQQHPWNHENIPKMVKQITTASYHIPPTIGNAAADLIKSLLKLRPQDRPLASNLLSHPWLKLAPAKIRNANNNNSSIKSPTKLGTMKTFTDSMNRTSNRTIVNPLASSSSLSEFDKGISSCNSMTSVTAPQQKSKTRNNRSFSGLKPLQPPGTTSILTNNFKNSSKNNLLDDSEQGIRHYTSSGNIDMSQLHETFKMIDSNLQ